MYLIGNLVIGIAHVLDSVCFIATILILASVVITWINADPYNNIVVIVNKLTNPVFKFIAKRMPVVFGGIDFTALIALLGLMFIQQGIIPSLLRLGLSMQ